MSPYITDCLPGDKDPCLGVAYMYHMAPRVCWGVHGHTGHLHSEVHILLKQANNTGDTK